jgi:hypothetical protein
LAGGQRYVQEDAYPHMHRLPGWDDLRSLRHVRHIRDLAAYVWMKDAAIDLPFVLEHFVTRPEFVEDLEVQFLELLKKLEPPALQMVPAEAPPPVESIPGEAASSNVDQGPVSPDASYETPWSRRKRRQRCQQRLHRPWRTLSFSLSKYWRSPSRPWFQRRRWFQRKRVLLSNRHRANRRRAMPIRGQNHRRPHRGRRRTHRESHGRPHPQDPQNRIFRPRRRAARSSMGSRLSVKGSLGAMSIWRTLP